MELIKLLGKRNPVTGMEAVPAFYAKTHVPFVFQGQPLTTVEVGGGYFYVLPPTIAATTPEEHDALVAVAAQRMKAPVAPTPAEAAPELQIVEAPTPDESPAKKGSK